MHSKQGTWWGTITAGRYNGQRCSERYMGNCSKFRELGSGNTSILPIQLASQSSNVHDAHKPTTITVEYHSYIPHRGVPANKNIGVNPKNFPTKISE